jgi:phosphoribosylformimino-5-aminoimidazole carboxamide ribotide isomerase
MIIFPAIDIKLGKCVRLYKGDINKVTVFNDSVLNQAASFKKAGFNYLHIVNLDSAINGSLKNNKIIVKLIKTTKQKIQLGGGIRTLKEIDFWLNCGVDKIVLGTMPIEKRSEFLVACKLFPGKIAVAVDVRKNFLAVRGWLKQTRINFFEFINTLKDSGVSRIIYTDIDKDGTKTGINLNNVKNILKKINLPIVISGGVSNLQDVKNISALKKVEGLIIGKAIYDQSINLKELKLFNN